jgi:SAM-dependent methyltransferase
MSEISEHTRKYWSYEYDVTARFMIPLLQRWSVPVAGAAVLDVGCAEGGGLCAMHDAGGVCAGYDLDEQRIAAAVLLRGDRTIDFRAGDVYKATRPHPGGAFDLVMLHDVFEHLDHKQAMMAALGEYLKPEGRLLITFPPYYSAYGAHQQHLQAWFARIPFFHLVPLAMSGILPRLKNESPVIIEEIQKLSRLKMGMAAFEDIAASSGMNIMRKRAYLISPNHIRFGLLPVPAGPVAKVPLAGELLCTGVVYLLGKARA